MAVQTYTDLGGMTLCLSKAVTAVGGTATKVKFTAPNGAGIDYAVNGELQHKAEADDVWTLSGTALTYSEMCIFLLCLNAAGTASIIQGDIVKAEDVYNGLKTVEYPPVTADVCSVGAVLVETNSDTAFTPGTTSLAASGVTDTYFNHMVPPNKGLGDANVTNTTFA